VSEGPLLDREGVRAALTRLGERLARRGVVAEEARAVADEMGLPHWWLNEQASVYVASGGDANAATIFEHRGLRVSAASPEHLLAMNVLAARRRDIDDIRFLVDKLKLSDAESVIALCSEIFPDEPLPARARLVLEDVFAPSDGE
jgi:hypothetical protein